jgi:signal peptidase II
MHYKLQPVLRERSNRVRAREGALYLRDRQCAQQKRKTEGALSDVHLALWEGIFMTGKSTKTLLYSALAAALLIGLDQVTKLLAIVNLKGKSAFSLIDGVFELRYLENQSAAFSMDPVSLLHKIFQFSYFNANPDAFLRCKMAFFVLLTVVVLVILVIFYRKVPWNRRFLPLNLILIAIFAGAVGNLIDRIVHNYVVDFFYFRLINFPVFNVADIYVTVAAIALIAVFLFYYKEEDLETLFPSKKKKKE